MLRMNSVSGGRLKPSLPSRGSRVSEESSTCPQGQPDITLRRSLLTSGLLSIAMSFHLLALHSGCKVMMNALGRSPEQALVKAPLRAEDPGTHGPIERIPPELDQRGGALVSIRSAMRLPA